MVYQALGFDKKPLSVSYGVISKINKDKHNVPVSVVEDLPELVSDPVAIFKSNTDPDNSVVAVLDAKDTGERTVVSIIRKTDGSYNVIPSVYENNNFVVEFATAEMKGQDPEILSLYNVAVKKQATTSSSNALSPESNAIMQPETPVVKQLNQRRQANGMYDPELNVIVLGRNFNTTTLPHELSHFWLNNTFQLFKQAQKGYPVVCTHGIYRVRTVQILCRFCAKTCFFTAQIDYFDN